MATNKKAAKQPKAKNAIEVGLSNPEENPDKASARVLSQPEIQAALTIQQWQGNIIDVNQIAGELKQQTDRLKTGSMDRAEAMLLSQAHTLDELFNRLAMKAHGQEYLKNYEVFLRLALKAQAQSRATLEALSSIKNPPVVYAKQANFSNGPQQVNNGIPATRTNENQNQQNELLTVNHGETLDSIRTGETIGSNPAMATLESINGAED